MRQRERVCNVMTKGENILYDKRKVCMQKSRGRGRGVVLVVHVSAASLLLGGVWCLNIKYFMRIDY